MCDNIYAYMYGIASDASQYDLLRCQIDLCPTDNLHGQMKFAPFADDSVANVDSDAAEEN